jgi:hypothetical protein
LGRIVGAGLFFDLALQAGDDRFARLQAPTREVIMHAVRVVELDQEN